MGVKIGDYPCEDAGALARHCQEVSPPLPLAPWYGAANRWTHAIGLRPGRGHILLRRKYLNKLNAVNKYTLEFSAFPANTGMDSEKRKIKNVRVVGTPINITPGLRDDEDATYFVELVDQRIDCVGLCGKRYNWRIHPDSTYESTSLNSGSEWTWTTLLQDLWNAVGCLGTWPGLPSTPAGTPSQIDGMGCRAADLLEDLLLLNGMAVRYDPENGSLDDYFSIIVFASESTGFFGKTLIDKSLEEVGTALIKADKKRIWDQEPLVNTDPKVPGYVRVVFPVWSPGGTPIDTASYYVVDVKNPSPDSTQLSPTSYALVQDFLPCRTNQVGTVLNGSDLVSRAAAVAANFYSVAKLGTYGPLSRTYTGIGQGSVVLPGTAIDVMVWEDVGDGPKTHVIQTGRLGFPPIFNRVGSLYTSGALKTGNPMGSASNFCRTGTSLLDPIRRVANIPPGELRTYGTGPFANSTGNTVSTTLATGGGESSVIDRDGPLRQWDAAVEARSVDGHGQRLWKAKERPEHSCFIKITSLTKSGIYYPGVEQLIDPTSGVVTTGDVCWWYDPNTSIAPGLNSVHWSYLDGSDEVIPATSAKKMYMASTGAAMLSSSLGMSAARVYNSSYTVIPTATTVTLGFDLERFDTDNFHDPVTNNSRFTIPVGKGGVYLVGAQVNWASAIVATFSAQIILNGATILAKEELDNKSNYFSTLYQFAEGDYVEVQVYHANASAVNVDVQANYSAEFWIMRAGASTASSLGRVYGQAKESPALPGAGPRQTMDMTRATPTVGNNLDVTLTDDAGNDRLTWTFDNLGIFTRANATAPTYGPRRRLDIKQNVLTTPSGLSGKRNITVSLADDGANDESAYTIDPLGVFGRDSTLGSYSGPRRSVLVKGAVPSSGLVNVSASVADAPANDELQWTIDNLGVFARVNSGTTRGPRRRLNFNDDYYGYIQWTATDDPGSDEVDLLASLNLGNVTAAMGADWHYWRQVDPILLLQQDDGTQLFGDTRHFDPWPVEYSTLTQTIYPPGVDAFIVAVPYLERRGGTLDRIGVYCNAYFGSAWLVRLGIYRAISKTNLAPGALVLDAGNVPVTGVPDGSGGTNPRGLTEATIAQALAPGLYYLAFQFTQADVGDPSPIGTLMAYSASGGPFWNPYGVIKNTTSLPGDGVLGADGNWIRSFWMSASSAGPGWNGDLPLPDPFYANLAVPRMQYGVFTRDGSTPIIFVHYSA